MVIQHNMPAIYSQYRFKKNNSRLSKSLEKLSSGYAINRAGDNAAGLAVSEKMRSQIFGIKQSVQNCADGVSLIQTFEGALGETVSIIHRARDLAEQAANGTYQNDVDREAIQIEYSQLCDEVDHIADTDFNGVVMLNGGRMSDTFTVIGENGTSWIFPEKISFEKGSYKSTIADKSYEMKIELMPGVANAPANKNTFEALAQLDKASIAVDVKNGVPKFYFTGDYPKGLTIETVENEGIISLTNPTSGIVEVAKVSVPMFEHNASSTGKGGWIYTTNSSTILSNLRCYYRQGISSWNVLTNADVSDTIRPSYLEAMEYLSANPYSEIVEIKTDYKHTSINGASVPKNRLTEIRLSDTTLHLCPDYNEIKVKPGSIITVSANKQSETSMRYASGQTADGYSANIGRISTSFNEEMFKKYGTGIQIFEYDSTSGEWYNTNDTNHTDPIDISTANIDTTITIQEYDQTTGSTVDVQKDITKLSISIVSPYAVKTTYDGYYYSSKISNSDFTLGEYDENAPDLGGIDYHTAEDGAVYTYFNPGINSSNPDTVGYWVDQNNNRVNLESVGVYLPKKCSAQSDILHDGMTIKVSNPLAGSSGNITADIKLWDSQTDAFRVAYENLTYTDNLTLQAGSRTKDSVNFTFAYNSDELGGLEADLDCTANGLGMDKLSLATQEKANLAIDKLDNALNKVSMIRSTFGAAQNRLEHKIDNLNNNSENLTSAESRIRDTDMAKEMMEFTKEQILSQSSQAMLAQANSLPQSVLNLVAG